MSMIGCVMSIDAAGAAWVRANPEQVWEVADGEQDAPIDTHRQHLDCGKAWHAMHYFLTGTTWEGEWPLAFWVQGGCEVGEMGYGPGRLISSTELVQLAAALDKVDVEQWRRSFDPAAMTKAEIYPDAIWEQEGEEALEYVLGAFQPLREFVKRAVDRGDSMLVWIE